MAQLISTPNAQSVDGMGIVEYAGIVLQIVGRKNGCVSRTWIGRA